MGPNLLSANRKSYTAYQMVSFSMTKSRLQKYAIIVVGTAQPLTRVPGVEVPLDCEFLAVHTSFRQVSGVHGGPLHCEFLNIMQSIGTDLLLGKLLAILS